VLNILGLRALSCVLRSSSPRGLTCIYLNTDFNAVLNSQKDLLPAVHGAGWCWWDAPAFSRGHQQDRVVILLTPPT